MNNKEFGANLLVIKTDIDKQIQIIGSIRRQLTTLEKKAPSSELKITVTSMLGKVNAAELLLDQAVEVVSFIEPRDLGL